MSYLSNLGSMATRFGNSLFGGNKRGESMSSAVIAFEAIINVPFAVLNRERHHCDNQFRKESET